MRRNGSTHHGWNVWTSASWKNESYIINTCKMDYQNTGVGKRKRWKVEAQVSVAFGIRHCWNLRISPWSSSVAWQRLVRGRADLQLCAVPCSENNCAIVTTMDPVEMRNQKKKKNHPFLFNDLLDNPESLSFF